jgi:hypothetical protein
LAADPISSSAYRRSSQIYGGIRAAPYFLLFLALISADYAVMANILPAVKKETPLLGGGGDDERRNDAQGGTKFRARSPSSRMRIKLQTRAPTVNCKFPSSGCRRRSRLRPVCAGKWGKKWIEFFFVPAVARLPQN